MSKTPDYYATLHIPRDATPQQIGRAYRALMRSHHPDMDSGRAQADGAGPDEGPRAAPPESELLGIMQAFAVLRDPGRRAAYDREIGARAAAKDGPGPAPGAAPEETPGPAGPAARGPRNIPVRKVQSQVQTRAGASAITIRITPVRWESGPWA